MTGFVRRYPDFPSTAEILAIEGVVIVDRLPPGVTIGRQTGRLALVGEWPRGPVLTPIEATNAQTIRDVLGSISLGCQDPLAASAAQRFSNGNAAVWLRGKRFKSLVLVRPDLRLVGTVTITVSGTPSPLTAALTIPGGTRIRNPATPAQEFALADDLVIPAGTALPFTSAAQRVVSTLGTTGTIALVTQVDANDLFAAGIGAGTALPSLTVASANAAALTVLNSAAIDAAYVAAINATLPGPESMDLVDIIASARQSTAIRAALLANAVAASRSSTGRIALLRAPAGTLPAAAIGAADPGVGANRGDRAIFCYPHFSQYIPELAALDPTAAVTPSTIVIGGDAAAANVLSILAPERNPGQATEELSYIRDLETGLTGAGLPTAFTEADYRSFKAAGIMALRRDPRLGIWTFMSGVTAVNPTAFPQLAPVKRRRMADFCQDSLAGLALRYAKLPATEDRVDSLVGEIAAFLEILKSPTNPAAQRIRDYAIDPDGGNTEATIALGIRVIIVRIRLLDTMDDIVLQVEAGETVSVTVAA